MPGHKWEIKIDGQTHEIRVEHGKLLRKYSVLLDGTALDSKIRVIKTGSAVFFNIEEHECYIIVRMKELFLFEYDLIIDGFSVDTVQQVKLPEEVNLEEGWFRSLLKDIFILGAVFWVIDLIFGYLRRNYSELLYGVIIIGAAVIAAYFVHKYYKNKDA